MIFRGKLFHRSLCLLLLALFARTICAQTVQERGEKIRASVESGDLKAALADLKSVRKSDASGFALATTISGSSFGQTARQRAALAGYQSVVARHSLLSQYAIWHLAQSARATGDLVLERERLRQLTMTATTSLLREAATMRLAESFFESADYPGVVSTLRSFTESKNVPLARQALALSGEASQRAGKTVEARDAFTVLITKMPDSSRPDDFALAAARGLDVLDKADPGKLLSEADHLLRATIYQFNRDFEHARFHYLAIVENSVQSTAIPESLYQVGRGLYQEQKYDEALKYLQRVASSYDTSGSARDALALIAGTYSRQQRTDDAITAYQELIKRFPTAPNPERTYLNIIDVLRDAGRDDEALSWVKRTRERFKDQIGGTLALFAQAKIHITQDSWRAAVTDLEELRQAPDLGGARIPGGTTSSEVSFLRAFALEQAGRTQEAIDAYLAIPEGRNEYYGFRANERLRALNADAKSRPFIAAKADALRVEVKQHIESGELEAARRAGQSALRVITDGTERVDLVDRVRRTYASSPAYRFPSFSLIQLGRPSILSNSPAKDERTPSHQVLADELLFLGLYDEGRRNSSRRRGFGTPRPAAGKQHGRLRIRPGRPDDYTLAVYFLRGDLPYPAVRFAEQAWRSIPSDYLLELAPRQMAEMLYPAPYRNSLLRHAVPRKLDPRFVLAIARQETRFQADAKSVAAARGLMQFISATATDTAKQLGRRDFRQDDLYNPDTAIEFGSQYLASLFQRFPDQPQAVAASYNGGADNVARWVARSHSQDADRYVPEIGFAQSKDYVYRVMSNFWVYQKLYRNASTGAMKRKSVIPDLRLLRVTSSQHFVF